MLIYPSRYYHSGRNLPFPGIDLKGLENLEVYLPIVAIAISFYVPLAGRFGAPGKDRPAYKARQRSEGGTVSCLCLLFSL